MIASVDFPRLTEQNHRITSPATAEYNCIAWSANDVDHWWEPGVFWPLAAAVGDYGIGTLEQAFRSLHFEECDDATLEPGFEKVALYGDSRFYTHAARQLPNGKWTSKLGRMEDIEHETPDDVAGGAYGEVAQILRRAVVWKT
jgi:hypothetical protein